MFAPQLQFQVEGASRSESWDKNLDFDQVLYCRTLAMAEPGQNPSSENPVRRKLSHHCMGTAIGRRTCAGNVSSRDIHLPTLLTRD